MFEIHRQRTSGSGDGEMWSIVNPWERRGAPSVRRLRAKIIKETGETSKRHPARSALQGVALDALDGGYLPEDVDRAYRCIRVLVLHGEINDRADSAVVEIVVSAFRHLLAGAPEYLVEVALQRAARPENCRSFERIYEVIARKANEGAFEHHPRRLLSGRDMDAHELYVTGTVHELAERSSA